MRVAIVGTIVFIGVTILVIGGAAQINGPANIQRNPEIVTLEPNESDQQLPQGEVGAQLRGQFNAQISIDGRVIPQDQVTVTPGVNTIFFDPGPGKDIREFTKGGHTALLEWWPPNIATPEAARAKKQYRSYSWTFNVG
jgi:hypothetical protein